MSAPSDEGFQWGDQVGSLGQLSIKEKWRAGMSRLKERTSVSVRGWVTAEVIDPLELCSGFFPPSNSKPFLYDHSLSSNHVWDLYGMFGLHKVIDSSGCQEAYSSINRLKCIGVFMNSSLARRQWDQRKIYIYFPFYAFLAERLSWWSRECYLRSFKRTKVSWGGPPKPPMSPPLRMKRVSLLRRQLCPRGQFHLYAPLLLPLLHLWGSEAFRQRGGQTKQTTRTS